MPIQSISPEALVRIEEGNEESFLYANRQQRSNSILVEHREQEEEEQEEDQTHDYFTIIKNTIRVSALQTGSRIVFMAGNFAGGLMLARVDLDTLAAAAFISSMQTFLQTVSTAPLNSIGSLVANKFGSKNPSQYAELGKVLRQGQILGTICTIPTLPLAWYSGLLLQWLGQDKIIADTVQAYFRASIWGMLPSAWLVGSQQFAFGVNKQISVFVQSIVGLAATLAASYGLIFGKWGLPMLGAAGFGYATSIRAGLNWLMLELQFLLNSEFTPYHLHDSKNFHEDKENYLKQLWDIGWPIGLQYGLELSSIFATTTMAGYLGRVNLEVRTVSSQYTMLLVVPLFAFAQASTVLVGQARGQGNYVNIRKYGNTNIVLGAGFALAFMGAFMAFRRQFIDLFIDDNNPANTEINNMLDIVMLLTLGGQVIDSVRNIATGALRAFYETKFPSLAAFLSLWVIKLPISYALAFPMGWGLYGLSAAHDIGLLFGASAVYARWRSRSNYPEVEEHIEETAGGNTTPESTILSPGSRATDNTGTFFACCAPKKKISYFAETPLPQRSSELVKSEQSWSFLRSCVAFFHCGKRATKQIEVDSPLLSGVPQPSYKSSHLL